MKNHSFFCPILCSSGWMHLLSKYGWTTCYKHLVKVVPALLLLFVLGSCQEEPKESQPYYRVDIFNLGDDNAIAISSDPAHSNFYTRVYQKFGHRMLPPGYQVKVGRYIQLAMEGRFMNDKYPDALVDIFVIENLTDKAQKCFVYQSGYHPAFILSHKRLVKYLRPTSPDQERTIEGFVKVPTVQDIGNQIAFSMSEQGDPATLPSYWEEIHKLNSSIALELAPRQKLHLKWKLK